MSIEQFLSEFAERDWQEREGGTIRLAMVGMGWWTTEETIPAIEAVYESAESGEHVEL